MARGTVFSGKPAKTPIFMGLAGTPASEYGGLKKPFLYLSNILY